MIQTEYVTYKEGMMLKAIGYDEPCDSFYQDAVRHNGKDLSFDEGLDLKDEGKGNEIKRIKGASVGDHYNRNNDNWLGVSCCSRPTLSQALRWLREVGKWHIGAYPSKDTKWYVWIVRLGELNPADGRLNACNMDGKGYPSYEAALHGALLFYLSCITNGMRFTKKNEK